MSDIFLISDDDDSARLFSCCGCVVSHPHATKHSRRPQDNVITISLSSSRAHNATVASQRVVSHISVHAWSHTQSVCAPHRVSIGLRVTLFPVLVGESRRVSEQNKSTSCLLISSLHHITPHHQNTNTPWCVVLAGVGVWCVPRAAMLRSHRHVPLWTPQHNNRAPLYCCAAPLGAT